MIRLPAGTRLTRRGEVTRDVLAALGCLLAIVVTVIALILIGPARAIAAGSTGCEAPTTHQVKGTASRSTGATFARAQTWIYGDSITFQTWTGLHISGGLAHDATWGRTTSNGLTALAGDLYRYGAPRRIVLALGTNDRAKPVGFRKQVARAMRLIPRRVRVVWVNLYTEDGSPAAPLNRAIEDSRAVVARWARAQGGRPSPLLIDGKHVNAAGCTVRDSLIEQALR